MSCRCRVCRLLRRIAPLRDRANRQERRALDDLLADWAQQGTDAIYWQAKYRGTWPETNA